MQWPGSIVFAVILTIWPMNTVIPLPPAAPYMA
jgi:hypothetical protein